jgi:hypothetical protein
MQRLSLILFHWCVPQREIRGLQARTHVADPVWVPARHAARAIYC